MHGGGGRHRCEVGGVVAYMESLGNGITNRFGTERG